MNITSIWRDVIAHNDGGLAVDLENMYQDIGRGKVFNHKYIDYGNVDPESSSFGKEHCSGWIDMTAWEFINHMKTKKGMSVSVTSSRQERKN